jgi:uncharacterized protein
MNHLTRLQKQINLIAFKLNNQLIQKLAKEAPFLTTGNPIVYILISHTRSEAYIGYTTDISGKIQRLLIHGRKNRFSNIYIIYCTSSSASVMLYMESFLIEMMAADGKYTLHNSNLGLRNEQDQEQEKNCIPLCREVWQQLTHIGIANQSIESIRSSPMFTFSPYKALNGLQYEGLLAILRNLLRPNAKHVVMEAGCGTGKTILALFMLKLLCTDFGSFDYSYSNSHEKEILTLVKKLHEKYQGSPKVALVLPLASLRHTIRKIACRTIGLNSHLIISPAEAATGHYDLIIVDEAHRLRSYKNLGSYYQVFNNLCKKLGLDKDRSSELDWLTRNPAQSLFFYDETQSIKPSDVAKADFEQLKGRKYAISASLPSSFRLSAENDYAHFYEQLLSCQWGDQEKAMFKGYELCLFDNIHDFVRELKKREQSYSLCRMVAGYAWPWISFKNPSLYDITIGDFRAKWNSTTTEWITSPGAIDEIGSIHTVQGYELNYVGVIFGPEISYDKHKNEIVIYKGNYHDRNGKTGITDPAEFKRYIINIYRILMMRGIKGTFVYACNKELQEYFARHMHVYRPRADIMEDEINDRLIQYLARHPKKMFDMSPRKFEELVCELLRDMGYDVYLTPATRDGGKDIIAVSKLPCGKKVVTLVECKRNKADNLVGVGVLREFMYTIAYHKVNAGLITTTSDFSGEAYNMQNEVKWQLGLHNFRHVQDWLSNYGQWKQTGKNQGLWLPDDPLK